MDRPSAAVVGAGVIGCGWVARMVACGWRVNVFDPDPDAIARVQRTVEHAKPYVQALNPAAEFDGEVRFCSDLAGAVAGVDWVQECLPEDLALKRRLFDQLSGDHGLVASSTSGFKPSVLGEGYDWADRLLVCHPFNPVYLLPLVEVVPHRSCDEALIEATMSSLTALGMHPLRVRQEVDGHIADRLLEAVWREALWMVRDGVATTEEIDAAIKHGFGLRWAQMGLFETYRLGGGDNGLRQFIAQFGPALKWPWSRLIDVPELDDALIDKLVEQCEAQNAGETIQQMTARRDRNLVAIMQALERSGGQQEG